MRYSIMLAALAYYVQAHSHEHKHHKHGEHKHLSKLTEGEGDDGHDLKESHKNTKDCKSKNGEG